MLLSTQITSKVWDELMSPFPNINGTTIEVWELTSQIATRFVMDVIIHACLDYKWKGPWRHQCLWYVIWRMLDVWKAGIFNDLFCDDVIKWKIFSRYWPLLRESTGHRWIPLTKASDAGFWCFLQCAPEQTVDQIIGDLRCHGAHCDVIVMRSS